MNKQTVKSIGAAVAMAAVQDESRDVLFETGIGILKDWLEIDVKKRAEIIYKARESLDLIADLLDKAEEDLAIEQGVTNGES
ncbi:hypothetical protein ACRXCV_00155 (plasmid) [Halobacteriovorax sp. GFR7]|uniref:hypothetical protein n=1 Tax=unclassified Halobacteriovorax TaxID=2639665 RepID=UPI003D998C59